MNSPVPILQVNEIYLCSMWTAISTDRYLGCKLPHLVQWNMSNWCKPETTVERSYITVWLFQVEVISLNYNGSSNYMIQSNFLSYNATWTHSSGVTRLFLVCINYLKEFITWHAILKSAERMIISKNLPKSIQPKNQ